MEAETVDVECRPIRAQEWLDEHERDLDGLTPDDAADLVAAAGLQPLVIRYAGGRVTQEERADRITLRLAEDGSVAAIDAG